MAKQTFRYINKEHLKESINKAIEENTIKIIIEKNKFIYIFPVQLTKRKKIAIFREANDKNYYYLSNKNKIYKIYTMFKANKEERIKIIKKKLKEIEK